MVILTAMELEVHFGEQVILDKASLSVHEGDRIGLVGRNGAGKSTFLKIISGLMPPDSGEVTRRRELVTGYLPQNFTLDEAGTVYENIASGTASEIDLLIQYEKLPFDSIERHKIEEKLNKNDSWALDKRIGVIMHSLNAPDKDRIVGTLSGGEKRRTALCRALISNPELLILDEPTNHLDTDSIEWLENFLSQYSGTCIFVTHDRYFLDRIANRIVELSDGTFYSHSGNYTDYLINKAERQVVMETEERKRQMFLRRELEWVRTGPRARRTKSKSRLDNYYELVSQEYKENDLDVDLIIPAPDRLGNKVLELKNLGYSISGRTLFQNFNFRFESGRKVGIVGSNGVGKTTLLRIILGEVFPTDGMTDIGETTQFNYVDQSRLLLKDNETVIQAIGGGNDFVRFGRQQLTIWSYLRRFLFTDDRINTIVGRLSGGEKSRLTLAKILCNGGNFLLLDEPTNDLDLPTLRILEEALIGFDGCLAVISHDRYFLNRVCNGILAFEEGGEIYFSEGGYDYYIEKKEKRKRLLIPEQTTKPREEKPKIKGKAKKLSFNEVKELKEIEMNIAAAEKEVKRIEQIFSDPEFFSKNAEKTPEFLAQLNSAKELLERLYSRWEELEALRESYIE
ncbi:MAG: ATP-binding cassette domain-containing protein [Ignavibacteriales bacterium]|nr:ATP-binding cassette domain-containing protein [Ignavibacteriales bacterium]MCF8316692.1 ATP-binding cassette domain-containing protein [Ignavibacteriales bacterium]MCF8438351.1 ATP-binding cassette domain-containing protein [Ignavibacteriales bacterium]